MGVVKIKDMPLEARPREKALFYGIESLSNDELLAIIISSGCRGESALDISKNLLQESLTLTSLSKISTKGLMKFKGVKEATALKLSSIFALAKRLNDEALICKNDSPLKENDLVKKYSLEMRFLDQEKVVLVLLNKKKRIIKEKTIALGSEKNVGLCIETIIHNLHSSDCSYFYLLHNHPSGIYNASDEDIIFTHKIKDMAKKNKILLLDHLIFSKNGCYSMGRDAYISHYENE